jgi:flagellar hook-basal body complex protein FliE
VNVKRTVEFILKSQAKTETRLAGITKLMQQGMRMLVRVETNLAQLSEAQKRTEATVAEVAEAQNKLTREMKELAKAQKHTEQALRTFILGQHNGRKNSGL